MVNKKGSVVIYGMMLGITIIILALALAPAGKQFISAAMSPTVGDAIGLDCSNSSISNFDKATCTITDFSLFYFFGGLILVGGVIVTSRIVFA